MCICINCAMVDRCSTYHQVEAIHQQPHLTDQPDFDPVHPTINVNLYDFGRGMEWDVVGCESFVPDQGKWARLRPGELIPT
jgi:hypothetical protein